MSPCFQLFQSDDEQFFVSLGAINAVLYRVSDQKVLHVKGNIARRVLRIELTGLPDLVREFVGERSYHPLNLEIPPEPRIQRIILDLTSRCNFRCKDCFSSDSGEDVSEEVVHWLDKLERKEDIQLHLLGGEPLLLPKERLLPLLRAWSTDFRKIVLYTNGSMLDDEHVAAFKVSRVNVRLTFYSSKGVKHDRYTGVPGSFKLAYRAAKLIEGAKIPLKLNLIFDGEDLLAIKTKKTVFDTLAAPRFIDPRRPAGKSCASVYEKDLLNDRVMNSREKHKPLTPLSAAAILQNLHYHPCHGGKVFVGTGGEIYNCIWKGEAPLAHIADLPSRVGEIGRLLRWEAPMRTKYSHCSQCEFCFLCFDCSSLNSYALNHDKPHFCTYNPLAGDHEPRESKIFR